MDITKFVADFRERAFLLGDYSTYHAQLSRRLRIVNKKLGRATPKNAKYAAKAPLTAEEIGKNIEYGCPWGLKSQKLTVSGRCTFFC
jgi:signal recognition particle subunit SRP68